MAKKNKQQRDGPDVAEVGDASLASGDLPEPPSGFTCPECGGALWEMQSGKLLKFRCHVGHSYTTEGLIAEQARSLESALWAALRSLEENAGLRRRLARRARESSWASLAAQYDRQAGEAEGRASVIRQVLMADQVRDTEFRAEPEPPRPKYDGPLYGAKGRKRGAGEKAEGNGKDDRRAAANSGQGNGRNAGKSVNTLPAKAGSKHRAGRPGKRGRKRSAIIPTAQPGH